MEIFLKTMMVANGIAVVVYWFAFAKDGTVKFGVAALLSLVLVVFLGVTLIDLELQVCSF